MKQLTHAQTTTAPTSGWGSNVLAGYQFAYDAASWIESINSYLDGLSEYLHDDTNQLTDADHASQADEQGNRVLNLGESCK